MTNKEIETLVLNMESVEMEYGHKTVFGTIVPNNLVNYYNELNVKIASTGSKENRECLRDKRHQVINIFCNPRHPLFIGSGEFKEGENNVNA